MRIRQLEKAKFLLKDATGHEISYVFDDLIFPDHTAFLLRFDDENGDNFFCHFHEECDPDARQQLQRNLEDTCQRNGCTLVTQGSFTLKPKGEEVNIHFL